MHVHHKQVSMKYWVEAVNTTIHLHAKFPHKAIQNVTSKELRNGRNPTMKHFKVFGCSTYALKLESTHGQNP
jgi:hypothetical protein